MREMLFLSFYGLLLISGAFMAWLWGRLAIDAWRALRRPAMRDRYWVVAAALALNSLATMVIFGARAVDAIVNDVWAVPGRLGWIILGGLALLEASKVMMVWAAALRPSARGWRWFAAISAGWTAFAILWAFA